MADRWIRRVPTPDRLGATIGTTGSCPPRTAECLSDAPVPYGGEGGYSITPLTGSNTWPCLDSPGEPLSGGGGYGYQGYQGDGVTGCIRPPEVLDVVNGGSHTVSGTETTVPLDTVAWEDTDQPAFTLGDDNDVLILEPGYYDVEYRVVVSGEADVDQIVTRLRYNGDELARAIAGGFLADTDGTPSITHNARVVHYFESGDSITLTAVAPAGGSATIDVDMANLVIVRVGCTEGDVGPQGPQGYQGLGGRGPQGYPGGGGPPCFGGATHSQSFLVGWQRTGKELQFKHQTLGWTDGCLSSAGDVSWSSITLCECDVVGVAAVKAAVLACGRVLPGTLYGVVTDRSGVAADTALLPDAVVFTWAGGRDWTWDGGRHRGPDGRARPASLALRFGERADRLPPLTGVTLVDGAAAPARGGACYPAVHLTYRVTLAGIGAGGYTLTVIE